MKLNKKIRFFLIEAERWSRLQFRCSLPTLFLFSFIYLCCPVLKLRRAKEKHYNMVGSGESDQWSSGFLALCSTFIYTITCIYNPTHSYILSSSVFHLIRILEYTPCIWHCRRHVYPIVHSIFLLYYSWTHHSSHSRASCFLSREWQITPSGSHSLWSPLHVAATIIPCTTFKHIPFALQFVQPGIITTPLNPPTPVLLHPSGSVLSLAFSAPPGKHSVLFMSSLFLFWQRSKVPKHESYLPSLQPLVKLYTCQDKRSCCVYVHACILWVCWVD